MSGAVLLLQQSWQDLPFARIPGMSQYKMFPLKAEHVAERHHMSSVQWLISSPGMNGATLMHIPNQKSQLDMCFSTLQQYGFDCHVLTQVQHGDLHLAVLRHTQLRVTSSLSLLKSPSPMFAL